MSEKEKYQITTTLLAEIWVALFGDEPPRGELEDARRAVLTEIERLQLKEVN